MGQRKLKWFFYHSSCYVGLIPNLSSYWNFSWADFVSGASYRKLGWLPMQVFLCEEFKYPVETHHDVIYSQKGGKRNPSGKGVLITLLISTCNECFIIKYHYYIAINHLIFHTSTIYLNHNCKHIFLGYVQSFMYSYSLPFLKHFIILQWIIFSKAYNFKAWISPVP